MWRAVDSDQLAITAIEAILGRIVQGGLGNLAEVLPLQLVPTRQGTGISGRLHGALKVVERTDINDQPHEATENHQQRRRHIQDLAPLISFDSCLFNFNHAHPLQPRGATDATQGPGKDSGYRRGCRTR